MFVKLIAALVVRCGCRRFSKMPKVALKKLILQVGVILGWCQSLQVPGNQPILCVSYIYTKVHDLSFSNIIYL